MFATRTAEVRVLSEAVWQLISNRELEALEATTIADLVDIELLVASAEDELTTMLRRNNAAIAANPVLSLVVCPTAACQLGCPYCGQEHSNRWLAQAHQAQFLKIASDKLSRGKYRAIQLCWFGAEPLLGMRVIRSMTPRLRELASSHECSYSSRIITNGMALTDTVATELVKELGVTGIDVTLDGIAEAHDARRHTKSGRNSFKRIFNNLVALANRDDLDVEIKLRTNVDASNWEAVSPLIRMLAEAGVQQKIGYYVAPVHSWGNDADQRSLPRDEFARHEIEWFAQMMMHNFNVGLIPPRKPIVCLAVQRDGLLVEASGKLFNCTEAPYVPAYKDGAFSIGNVATGEVAEKRNPLADFNERVSSRHYSCSDCRMLPVCGGACPKGWLEGWRPCPSALDNMPERLLLAYAASSRQQPDAAHA